MWAAVRNENSATERQVERSMRSVRHACSADAPGIARPVLLRPVGVAHGHAHDHDRMDDGRRWGHARDTPPRPHDDRAAHALPQNAIRTADVAGRLGVMVAALSPKPVSRMAAAASRTTSLARRPPVSEREVEPEQFEVEAEDAGIEHPQRLVEQLLPGLVAIADDDLVAR